MRLSEIDKILKGRKRTLNSDIIDTLAAFKEDAIKENDEAKANELWCYETIYRIQRKYLDAYKCLKEGYKADKDQHEVDHESEKAVSYENAWNLLDQCDINIGFLEKNFCMDGSAIDSYHISDILEDIKRLQPLFPYKYFGSRETIITEQRCSICGKVISVRHPCGHIRGKLYMGQMCLWEITAGRFININLVTKPFDKYTIINPAGARISFEILDQIVPHIEPYKNWSYTTEKRLRPEYKKIGRNEKCPCGSGLKYKHCLRKKPDKHYMDHFKIKV